jgi:RHS repeat-associated protein
MVAAWGADSLTWSAQWAPGVDNLVSVRMGATGTEAFAVKDGRGNVTGYYRGQGSNAGLWVTAEYTPEGRVTQKDWVSGATCVETGTTQCPRMGGVPFGFHSAYKSPAHGLLYFRNRWYSAEAGQWLSHDPLGEVDSANLYAFNRFDSVNFVDPFGLESEGTADIKEGKCKSNDPSCQPGKPELSPVPTAPKFDDFLIEDAECQHSNKCLWGNLAKMDGQLNGPRQAPTPEEHTPAARRPESPKRPFLVDAIEFMSFKDRLFARVVGGPSGTNIGDDVGSSMRKLMDEGWSVREAIKTSLNMNLNPAWSVLEQGTATQDAVERKDTVRAFVHAGGTVIAAVSLFMIASGGAAGGSNRLFHGTRGDNVLSIIEKGGFIPKDGKVFFSRQVGDTFVHGVDNARGAALSIEVELASGTATESWILHGNPNAVVVKSGSLVSATVKTLIVRTKDGQGGFEFRAISGQEAIKSFLQGK